MTSDDTRAGEMIVLADVIGVEREVVYGVYDPANGQVRAPDAHGALCQGLVPPPTDFAEVEALAAALA